MNGRQANLECFVVNCIIAICFLVLVACLQIFLPVVYVTSLSEDNWSEYMTFVLFCMTSGMLAWILVHNREYRKPGYFAFALVALLVAFEEISWGQRIFNVSGPDILKNLNLQGELTVHNLFTGYSSYLALVVMVGVILLPLTAWLFRPVGDFCTRWGVPLVPVACWPLFSVPVLFWMSGERSILGIDLAPGYRGEVAEVGLAFATTTYVSILAVRTRFEIAPRWHAMCIMILTLLLIAASLTAPLVHFYSSPSSFKWGINRAAKRLYPEAGMYLQAETLFNHMVIHPQYADEDTAYYHGLTLFRLGRDEEAQALLESVLVQQSTVLQPGLKTAGYCRKLGKTLHSLNRIPEAHLAYLLAIALEQKPKGNAEAEAERLWSLGETLYAMGQHEAAVKYIESAVGIAPSPRLKHKIKKWYRREIHKSLNPQLLPGKKHIFALESFTDSSAVHDESHKRGTLSDRFCQGEVQ